MDRQGAIKTVRNELELWDVQPMVAVVPAQIWCPGAQKDLANCVKISDV